MNAPPPPPRYVAIAEALRARILAGDWPPGHPIPTEASLMAEFGCSRMTVYRALWGLAEAGLITRRRRAGSHVAAPRREEAVFGIHDIEAEIARSGAPYRYERLSRVLRPAGRAERARLGLSRPAEVLALGARHFAGPRAFVLEDRLIHLAAVPAARSESFATVPPGRWLLSHVPWNEAEHRISAEPAGAFEAAALAIPRGAPLLVLARRTWSGEVPVTAVRLCYPGPDYALVGRFRPGG